MDDHHERPSFPAAPAVAVRLRRRRGAGRPRRTSDVRAIFEASPILLVELDPVGTVLRVNCAVEEASGLPRDALVGRAFEALLAPARERFDAWAPGAPAERALRTAGGGERPVEWRLARGAAATWAFGVDVTDARAAARRLRVVEQLAVVGELTTGLAHEIRNPLNSALLELTVLARRLGRSKPGPELASVEEVRRELGRIDRLLTDFLWFARPLSPTTLPGGLAAPAEAVARVVSAEAASRGITLVTSFDPDAAPVDFDEDSIRQVIFNLVRNALEAVPRGGRITLRVRAARGATELDVEDDGPGIPGDPAKVFAPFYSTRVQGTGLGLTIAQRIATDHGGEIRVESAPGRTVFTLSLPAAKG